MRWWTPTTSTSNSSDSEEQDSEASEEQAKDSALSVHHTLHTSAVAPAPSHSPSQPPLRVCCCALCACVATVVQCDGGKHGGGCLGGRGGHGKRGGGGALNIIVGVPTPVPTAVPVPVYAPMHTVERVHYEPQTYQTKQQVQVPVTTKQQFQGQGTAHNRTHATHPVCITSTHRIPLRRAPSLCASDIWQGRCVWCVLEKRREMGGAACGWMSARV